MATKKKKKKVTPPALYVAYDEYESELVACPGIKSVVEKEITAYLASARNGGHSEYSEIRVFRVVELGYTSSTTINDPDVK